MKFKSFFKKSISAVLSAVLAASVMTGCGDKTADNSEVMTVTVWSADSHSKAAMVTKVGEFNDTIGKEQGIKIDYLVKEDMNNMLQMAYETGDAPDMYIVWLSDSMVEKGWVQAIDDMPGGKEMIEHCEGYIGSGMRKNGKTYRLPMYVNTFGLAYNKDMFKKYGIVDENGEPKAPRTYDEVIETARKLTHPDEKEFGFILPLQDSYCMGALTRSAFKDSCYSVYDPKRGEYDYSNHKSVFEMALTLKNEKLCYPGSEGLTNDQARAQFAEGKIGMIFSGSYDVGVFAEQFPAKCDWGVVPSPVNPGHEDNPNSVGSDGYFMMNKQSYDNKDKDKLMTVFKWFNSDDMARYLYKTGSGIPYNLELVKDVKVDNPKTGYEDFAKLSYPAAPIMPLAPDTDSEMTGEKKLRDVFLSTVWNEGKVDEALDDLTTRYNSALKRWYEHHPDKTEDMFTVK